MPTFSSLLLVAPAHDPASAPSGGLDVLISVVSRTEALVRRNRDTFRLLVGFVSQRSARPPSRLRLEDLDAPAIGAFLDHLETQRGNAVRTRNARLAAVHSLFRFAALHHPDHAGLIARVLAIPPSGPTGPWSSS
jgi:integrase/recombinase XerD